MANKSAAEGLKAIRALFDACADFNVTMANVSFDLSLARGLDYYTGVIYEAVLEDSVVGSVVGGGRYDGLVGMFAKKNRSIPCVGISFGIERLFTVVEQRKAGGFRASPTDVLVVSGQKTMERQRYQVCASLWDADVCAETVFKTNAKLMTQFQNAEKNGIPLMVIVGESEYAEGTVLLRDTVSRAEETIPIGTLVDAVKQKLSALEANGASAAAAVE
jgi:histidyl-tRNA synthetase